MQQLGTVRWIALAGLVSCVSAGAPPPSGPVTAPPPAPTATTVNAPTAPLPIALAPCNIPDVDRRATCGTAHVLEDRSLPHGRVIPLKVIVLPAKQTPSFADPVVFVAGGPGDAVTDYASWVPTIYSKVAETRDFVFIDQRGMGHDSPLRCKLIEPGDVGRLPNGELPEKKLKSCLASMDANPALYTTTVAAEDMNEVLGQLGYAQANIMGESYGTFATQGLVHAHPERVRSIILLGVVAPDAQYVIDFAQNAQAALDETIRECAADADCHAMHRDPTGALTRAFARLDAQPAQLTTNGPDEKPYLVTLDRKSFAFALRGLLYRAAARGRALSLIDEVAVGNYESMGPELLQFALAIGDSVSIGGYLSITCPESIGVTTIADVEKASTGTFLGTARALPIWNVCRFWPKGTVPAWLHDPVESDMPALMFGGTVDPATPLAGLEKARAKLKNTQAVIVKGAGHDVSGPCAGSIISSFLDHPLVPVDTTCVKPIVTDFPKPPLRLGPKVLDSCVGRFVFHPTVIMTVTREADQLYAQATGDAKRPLDAESPTLYRLRGVDVKFEFQIGTDGHPARLVVHYDGMDEAGDRVP